MTSAKRGLRRSRSAKQHRPRRQWVTPTQKSRAPPNLRRTDAEGLYHTMSRLVAVGPGSPAARLRSRAGYLRRQASPFLHFLHAVLDCKRSRTGHSRPILASTSRQHQSPPSKGCSMLLASRVPSLRDGSFSVAESAEDAESPMPRAQARRPTNLPHLSFQILPNKPLLTVETGEPASAFVHPPLAILAAAYFRLLLIHQLASGRASARLPRKRLAATGSPTFYTHRHSGLSSRIYIELHTCLISTSLLDTCSRLIASSSQLRVPDAE